MHTYLYVCVCVYKSTHTCLFFNHIGNYVQQNGFVNIDIIMSIYL